MIRLVLGAFAIGICLAAASAPAHALQTPQDCAPIPTTVHSSFYVDPEKGNKLNDGSKEHPWRTLEEVLDPANHLVATKSYVRQADGEFVRTDVNPNGPIKPGDALHLMSGDQGSPTIRQMVNDEFISVEAAPGQTPVVDRMTVIASSHWLFRGVKFQGSRPDDAKFEYTPLVEVSSHNWLGPSDNIAFVDDSISTTDDTEGWVPEDWVRKPYSTGLAFTSTCTTIAENHFYNLRDVIGVFGDRALVERNVIENMGNDGIDIAASDLVIRDNRIRSSRHSPAEPKHADGIQGWTLRGATNRNIVVDSNSIINANPSDDNYLQGISIFDGHWDGLTVVNNVVVTNIWHGIALYGVDNAVVVNNTVLAARPDKFPTWITIHEAKDKTPSRHVVVRNNIATQIDVAGEDITVDHNIAEKEFSYQPEHGGAVKITLGAAGDNNRIEPFLGHTFADYDVHAGDFDLRPRADSPAARAGAEALAPAVDVEGRRRVPPVDIGAYAR